MGRLSIALDRLPQGRHEALNNDIRTRCWHEFCSRCRQAPGCATSPCAKLTSEPRCAQPLDCLAHKLFPTQAVDEASGERRNRGAFLPTVHCRWLPEAGEMVLWLFGMPALAAEEFVLGVVKEWHGAPLPAVDRTHGTLGSLLPAETGDYRLNLVTPWILSSGAVTGKAPGDLGSEFVGKLRTGLSSRARKLTNTSIVQCPEMAAAPLSVRILLGFAAEHVVNAVCDRPGGFEVVGHELTSLKWPRFSGRTRKTFDERGVTGWVHLRASPEAAHLLPLLAVFGAGDSPDKAYGSVEVTRVDGILPANRRSIQASR